MKKDTESKVIIIGNSANVLENEYGSIIDSYDVVIRINRCVTKGFEKYIGSKTDIWATSSWCLKSSPDNLKSESGELGLPYFMPDNFEKLKSIWFRTNTDIKRPNNIERWNKLVKKIPNTYSMWKTAEFSKNFKKYIKDDGINMKHSGVTPDTGTLTILTSMLFYENITIHGFTFYIEKDNTITKNPWYYKEAEINESGSHAEDIAWERQITRRCKTGEFLSAEAIKERKDIVNELVETGVIKWLTKKSKLIS
jgi:hypothetical protein